MAPGITTGEWDVLDLLSAFDIATRHIAAASHHRSTGALELALHHESAARRQLNETARAMARRLDANRPPEGREA